MPRKRTNTRGFVRKALFLAGLASILFFLAGSPASAKPEATAGHWLPLEHISPDSDYGAFAPTIRVAPDKTIMVMYNHERTPEVRPPNTPYFSRSDDGGQTWSTGPAFSGSESAAHVDFAFDSTSEAHAVWRTDSGVYHAAEGDWPVSSGTQITPSEGRRVDKPAIAIDPDDNTIFVVWLQAVSSENNLQDVYYSYSRNGGQTWAQDSPLTTVADGSGSDAPDVEFDSNGNVHVVWEESAAEFGTIPPKVRYEIQQKQGAWDGSNYQWSSQPRILSDSHPGDAGRDDSDASRQPALTRDGDQLHVVFEERESVSGGDPDESNAQVSPYHVAFAPGSGWQAPQKVIGDTAFYVNTALPFYLGTVIAACGGDLAVYFHGALDLNSPEIIWDVSKLDGEWRSPEAVTAEGARHANPAATCDGNIVHLGFERILASARNHQIYYTQNTGGGVYLPIIYR